MKCQFLHIADPQTFTKPFFKYVSEHFDASEHVILTRAQSDSWPVELQVKHESYVGRRWLFSFLFSAKRSKKIFIHGLFNNYLVLILLFQPWLWKKCYWVIWGGDLYSTLGEKKGYKSRLVQWMRKKVIQHIGHLITYVEGDVELARERLGAKGQYHECLMYMSNIFDYDFDVYVARKSSSGFSIQLGNSAASTNNHKQALDIIAEKKSENISVYMPLSYGEGSEVEDIISYGYSILGDKFNPITDFMKYEDYQAFMKNIDIAFFYHNRQQAMGNTINYLGMGKKVYLKKGTSQWRFFNRLGVKVYDAELFDLTTMSEDDIQSNFRIVSDYFSYKNLNRQLERLFS